MPTAEHRRLAAHRERRANWKQWGPYLSERAWGTVRENYSGDREAVWRYFGHDHARSRAYRWNEDGLAGLCDRNQHLCLALALWNGADAILKERLFGLTGDEGNHGEDVKEIYHYLDATPTSSYLKMLYRYPQAAFPYRELVEASARRGLDDPEHSLLDTGVFEGGRYFDVVIEYAKVSERDLLWQITAHNRGPDDAPLWLLPMAWFRNTWSWGYPAGPMGDVPGRPDARAEGPSTVRLEHPAAGIYRLYARDEGAQLLFTENETHTERLFGTPNRTPYVKDAFHRYLIGGDRDAVHPEQRGTRVAALHRLVVPAGGAGTIQLRLGAGEPIEAPFEGFSTTLRQRVAEADTFYAAIAPATLSDDERAVQRQALAGMLWSKQLYYYDVQQWLSGDPVRPLGPHERQDRRNAQWTHLVNFDVISMPDKWEYPWYATWDLAFHCVALALVDVDFAKRQLVLLTREWYQHPNGQLPAYEWAFDDANPPVHAWAAWRVYQLEQARWGRRDRAFLETVFHKLLLNFTWWVNRKDATGSNVFQGGFLGLDNIGIFDRSKALPTGGRLDQSDGTAWMAAYCLQMMKIALELAREAPVYQDLATKLFEHFLRVADAMTSAGGGSGLWDEDDGFFYDALHLPGGRVQPLRVQSLVGLLPLFAADTIDPEVLEDQPIFARRMRWFVANRPELAEHMACVEQEGAGGRRLVSLLSRDRLLRVLRRLLDEQAFLSPYGVRSLSRHHAAHPYEVELGGERYTIGYEPGVSEGWLFGGNSNWRGPIWFPTNYLIIEALRRHHRYYGDDLKVECPTGSGRWLTLGAVADELTRRLVALFARDERGRRPIFGDREALQRWNEHLLFHEYFHGDTGEGLGAQHQTGWTGLIAELLQQLGEARGAD